MPLCWRRWSNPIPCQTPRRLSVSLPKHILVLLLSAQAETVLPDLNQLALKKHTYSLHSLMLSLAQGLLVQRSSKQSKFFLHLIEQEGYSNPCLSLPRYSLQAQTHFQDRLR